MGTQKEHKEFFRNIKNFLKPGLRFLGFQCFQCRPYKKIFLKMDPQAAPGDSKEVKVFKEVHQLSPEEKEKKYEEESEGQEVKESEAKFRCSALNVMLTFSQTGVHKSDVIVPAVVKILDEKGWSHDIMYADEQHKDGSNHVHAGIRFHKRPNIQNSRLFDYFCGDKKCTSCITEKHETLHPNFRRFLSKDATTKMWGYVNKTGRGQGSDIFPSHPVGYGKWKADKQLWLKDAQARNPIDPFPITLPNDEGIITKPLGYHRRSLYIIWGEVDARKSYFRKFSINPDGYYMPSDVRYPMEDYAGQQLIIYDDFDFKAIKDPTALLIKNLEWDNYKVNVGPARYKSVYYPKCQQRVVIILCNNYFDWFRDPRIESRTAKTIEVSAPIVDMSLGGL